MTFTPSLLPPAPGTPTATVTASWTPVPVTETFLQPPSAPILASVQSHARLADPSVIFVWLENPVWESVKRYKLVVLDAAKQRVYVQKLGSAVCEAGLCQLDLELAGVRLGNGAYTWLVQAKNGVGAAKSPAQPFIINYPGTATLLGPVDGLQIIDRSPVMTWSEVSAAAQYRLRIQKKGKTVFSKWLAVETLNCDGSVCSVDLESLGVQLPHGKLRWRVDTRNKAVAPNVSKSPWGKFRIIRSSE
jgi:hypothetical protein